MTDRVRAAYDANADRYAALFLNELDRDRASTEGLGALAERAGQRPGPVVDLGCGPGSAVNHLDQLGLTTIGLDLSPGQIAQAGLAFPALPFLVGDLLALPFADGSVAGIVARHSLIHLHPSALDRAFDEWLRVLRPGGPVFLSFFGSRSDDADGTPFDHKVVTAYELHPATMRLRLLDAGFGDFAVDAAPIPEGGRPFDHVVMLATKPER